MQAVTLEDLNAPVITKEDFSADEKWAMVLAGGVAANTQLRAALVSLCNSMGVRFCVPEKALCTDNAAMVGAQGIYEFLAGVRAATDLNASAAD